MKLRRHPPSRDLHINLVPFIDTLVLLLIFFMMTTTFNQQSQLGITLPEAKSDASNAEQLPQIVRVIVDEQGQFAINDMSHRLVDTQLVTLKRSLQDAVGTQQNPRLLISADANAPHHAVMKVMEAVRDLGFVRLSFETQHAPDSKTP